MALIGIDLGTTNSLIAHWNGDKAELIKNSLDKVMTPSVVSLDDQGQIVVGDVAKHRLVTHPQHTVAEFKRYMGTNKIFTLGNNKFRAEELSALVLKSLIADAEAQLGEKVDSAVISVPAYFSDAQRKATRNAGRLAGIEVKRLINEPTAAAIAYGLHEKEEDTTFLVFDIGGGTFDVSILELFEGVMQVNSTAGDNRLGGEDFLDAIITYFLKKHNISSSQLSLNDAAKLRNICENAKRELTKETQVEIEFPLEQDSKHLTFTRTDFERACADLLKRLRIPLERALKDASINSNDLDSVILVGGASRMPVIRTMVSKMLGKIPNSHINPDEIVALGASIQAALINGEKSLSEVVLTDVAPYSLGTGVVNESGFSQSGNVFHPIIDRNSPVPISKVDNFTTASNNQTILRFVIYQGEARLVNDNIELGELTVPVPSAPLGVESVDLRFTYDISGLLEVEATVISTGVTQRVLIEGNPGTLTETEINERLQTLSEIKIHPRENTKNALILARGEHLYEMSIGDKRQYIGSLLSQFEQTLQNQVITDIEKAAKEITKAFDQIDNDSPFN